VISHLYSRACFKEVRIELLEDEAAVAFARRPQLAAARVSVR